MTRNLLGAANRANSERPHHGRRSEAGTRLGRKRSAGAAYSRFVGAMKIVLPAIALILIVMVVVWPEFHKQPSTFQIGMARISVQEEEGGQKLVNARYTGVDKRYHPYTVTADAIVHGDPTEDLVELEKPNADITIEGGTWLAVTAPAGQFSRQHQVLELTGGVNVFHDQGYEFRTERAMVDFTRGTAFGDAPVRGQGPFGLLSSEGFLVLDSGLSVTFTGKARLVLFATEGEVKR
jgi:lipopolysaccharide export system protein LptC